MRYATIHCSAFFARKLSPSRISAVGMVLALVGLGGCATTQPSTYIPYAPRTVTGTGYQDRVIGPHEHEIQVVGLSETPFAQLEEFFHKRAGELCQPPQDYTHTLGQNYIFGRTEGAGSGYSYTPPTPYKLPVVTGVATCSHT